MDRRTYIARFAWSISASLIEAFDNAFALAVLLIAVASWGSFLITEALACLAAAGLLLHAVHAALRCGA